MKRCALVFVLVAVFVPSVHANAATIAELLAQLQTLTAQINAIKDAQGAATAPRAAPVNLTRNLSRGSRGEDVRQMQFFLIAQNLLATDKPGGPHGIEN